MSSNRSKPADRGATAPKPSRKVALDEVLRTLQDLVQHDLDVDSLPSRQAREPLATEVTLPDAAEPVSVPENTPSDTSATVPIADTIVLETPAPPPEDTTPAADTIGYTPAPKSTPPAPAKSKPARRATDRGVQQELPLLDVPASTTIDIPTPASVPAAKAVESTEPEDSDLPPLESLAVDWSAPAAAPAATRDAELSVVADDLPSLPMTPAPAVGEPAPPVADTAALTGTDDSPNDIPVLEDAVDFHHEPPADTHPVETAPAGPALPSANAARRLAIQVAARINVTLRKEGKAVLSSELIARLAHELEEALAKGASNMENNGPEKP